MPTVGQADRLESKGSARHIGQPDTQWTHSVLTFLEALLRTAVVALALSVGIKVSSTSFDLRLVGLIFLLGRVLLFTVIERLPASIASIAVLSDFRINLKRQLQELFDVVLDAGKSDGQGRSCQLATASTRSEIFFDAAGDTQHEGTSSTNEFSDDETDGDTVEYKLADFAGSANSTEDGVNCRRSKDQKIFLNSTAPSRPSTGGAQQRKSYEPLYVQQSDFGIQRRRGSSCQSKGIPIHRWTARGVPPRTVASAAHSEVCCAAEPISTTSLSWQVVACVFRFTMSVVVTMYSLLRSVASGGQFRCSNQNQSNQGRSRLRLKGLYGNLKGLVFEVLWPDKTKAKPSRHDPSLISQRHKARTPRPQGSTKSILRQATWSSASISSSAQQYATRQRNYPSYCGCPEARLRHLSDMADGRGEGQDEVTTAVTVSNQATTAKDSGVSGGSRGVDIGAVFTALSSTAKALVGRAANYRFLVESDKCIEADPTACLTCHGPQYPVASSFSESRHNHGSCTEDALRLAAENLLLSNDPRPRILRHQNPPNIHENLGEEVSLSSSPSSSSSWSALTGSDLVQPVDDDTTSEDAPSSASKLQYFLMNPPRVPPLINDNAAVCGRRSKSLSVSTELPRPKSDDPATLGIASTIPNTPPPQNPRSFGISGHVRMMMFHLGQIVVLFFREFVSRFASCRMRRSA